VRLTLRGERVRRLAAGLSVLVPAMALAQTPAGPPQAASAGPPQVEPERVTFAEAMRRAEGQATGAALAMEEVRRAQALLVESRAASLPFLSANASLTLLDHDRVQSGGSSAVLVPRDQRNANVSLQLPLLAPSRWASWAVASEQVQVARASEQDVRRTVLLTAARAYLSVLAQKRVVEVSRSARDIAKVRFDFAHARRTGGIGNAIDESRAQQQLATSEAQLRNGEVGLFRAQEALGTATGTDGALDASEEPAFVPAALSDAEARRADLLAAQERLEGVAKARRYSWTDWLPTLFAVAQPFYNDPSTATSPRTGWQVQFLLSLPLFEGGLRVGQLREREALEREARIQLDSTLRLVRSDVRLATESLSREEAALGSSRLAAEQARNVLQLTIEAYKAGATNDLDVSTAQQQSRDADLQVVIAEDAVRQARLDLLSAFGQFP
jgi:outer membrane protein TolC